MDKLTGHRRVIIYARRSVESDPNSVSLPAQVQACQQYITKIKAYTAHVLEHNGVSGGDPKRFLELDDALAAHNANTIVVYKMDRLARDFASCLMWLRAWAKSGVEVHAVDDGGLVEIEQSHQYISFGIQQLVAEYQRKQISERTQAALDYKRAKGERISRYAPFGYEFDTWGKVVERESEQLAIKRIQEMYREANGDIAIRAIMRHLYDEGFKSRNGKFIDRGIIRRIVKEQMGELNEEANSTTEDTPQTEEVRQDPML